VATTTGEEAVILTLYLGKERSVLLVGDAMTVYGEGTQKKKSYTFCTKLGGAEEVWLLCV